MTGEAIAGGMLGAVIVLLAVAALWEILRRY